MLQSKGGVLQEDGDEEEVSRSQRWLMCAIVVADDTSNSVRRSWGGLIGPQV